MSLFKYGGKNPKTTEKSSTLLEKHDYVSNSNKYSQLFLLKNFTAMSTHIQAQFELVVVCECESSVTWASRLVVDHLAMHVF